MPHDKFYWSKDWFKVRAKVLKRDGYKCQRCGIDVKGKGNAHVDHIQNRKQFPELALEMSNLWTLCPPCHSKFTHSFESNLSKTVPIGLDGYPVDSEWSD